MTTLHTAPVASTALVGAIDLGLELAEAAGFAHPAHMQRLSAIADACDGADFDELAGEYGPDEAHAAMQIVGSFFGGLKKIARKASRLARPLVSKGLQFVPGAGPLASTAFDAATASMSRGHAPQRAPAFPGGGGFNLRCVPFY